MSDFEKFCKEVLGIQLTPVQIEMCKLQAEAMAENKRVIVLRRRAAGHTTAMRALGLYLKRQLTDDDFELPKYSDIYRKDK